MPQAFDQRKAQKLQQAKRSSDEYLREFRAQRRAGIEKYVGRYYGDSSVDKREPFNQIYAAHSVFVPQLVMRNPTYRVRCNSRAHRAAAKRAEMDLNETAQELDMKRTLRHTTSDSMFGPGIVKHGYSRSKGRLFLQKVSLDDFILDPNCRDIEEATYMGNTFRVPVPKARRMYGDGLPSALETTGREESKGISGQTAQNPLYDYIELCDIWLPHEGVVVTVPEPESGPAKILNVVDWQGPEKGPYRILGYNYVGDNPLPMPPISAWRDLHDLVNKLARRVVDDVDRKKNVILYESGSYEDAQKIQEADNNEMVEVDNVDGVASAEFGGSVQGLVEWMQYCVQMFSRQSGNLDMLGGLRSDAQSATEAAKLSANANIRVHDMRQRVYDFAEKVGNDLRQYRHTDPGAHRRLMKPVKGTDIEVETAFSPRTRKGKVDDYKLDVVAHSMSAKMPDQHSQRILQWWNNVVLPTMNAAMQQGAQPDIPGMVRYLAEEMGLGDVKKFYQTPESRAQNQAAQGAGPQRPGGGENNETESNAIDQILRQQAENSGTPQPNSRDASEAGMEDVINDLQKAAS